MNAKNRRTLGDIFVRPTLATIRFDDLLALVEALGGKVEERSGSRIRIELAGEILRCHRPHPGKEAKRYQVEDFRTLLLRVGLSQ